MQDHGVPASPKAITIIWLAFLAAVGAYVCIGWLVLRGLPAGEYPMPLTVILCLAAAGCVGMGYVLPGRLQAKDRVPNAPAGTTADRVARYQILMIIRWACFEALAILGLVLMLLSGQGLPLVAGAAAAFVLIYGARPELDRQNGRR